MKSAKVVVVDYGVGNLLSVRRALEYVGAEVEQCADPDALVSAPKIILPGVGAFANGMNELRRLGLDLALREAAQRGTPIMGVCLGMQMLFDNSDEFGHSVGIGLIPGRIIGIPQVGQNGIVRKIPHIGWSDLMLSKGRTSWRGSILEAVAEGGSVYFVHSFMAQPQDQADCLAFCMYEGQEVTAVVAHGNISGCQFHPEKSGQIGLSILRKFIEI